MSSKIVGWFVGDWDGKKSDKKNLNKKNLPELNLKRRNPVFLPIQTLHYTLYCIVQSVWNIVVQSHELQGNRCGTGKSHQNCRGTGIDNWAGAAPLMEAPL